MQSTPKANKYSAGEYDTKMPVAATTTVVDLSSNLQDIMSQNIAKTAQFEQRLGALQEALSANLKEANDVLSLYNQRRKTMAESAANARQKNSEQVPTITQNADQTHDAIHIIEWKLPTILTQLLNIRKVYDLGRRRAQVLQAELEWVAKSDFERWRSTLLGKSPLSAQQVKREWTRLFKRLALIVLFISTLLIYFLWGILNRTPT